jgi:putative selenium metabolism protein SsnA
MSDTQGSRERVSIVGPGHVVTGFREPEVHRDGAVAWSGDRVLDVAALSELIRRHPEAEVVDAAGGLILPGLVNLHHHFYSSLARGIDPGAELSSFGEILDGLWWRLDRALDEDAVRVSAELALADSIRWGATTVFDHHASPSFIRGSLACIAEVVERAGLSAVLCYEVTDRNGHEDALAGIEENMDFFRSRAGDPRVRGMLGLHASFTVEDRSLETIARRRPDGMGCHLHLAEDPIDVSVSKVVFGAAPVERLDAYGLIDEGMLAVHAIHLGEDDRRLLARRGATIVHNPESNANNGVGRLDLDVAASDGCRIGLGTDGMGSAMLAALRAAFLGLRGGRRDPTLGFDVVPELLAVNAEVAGALLDEPLLGRLEKGAPADICVLDASPPTPIFPDNLFAHLVYGGANIPVRHTIARGRVVLRDHRHTTIDPREAVERARRLAPELWQRFDALGACEADWLTEADR